MIDEPLSRAWRLAHVVAGDEALATAEYGVENGGNPDSCAAIAAIAQAHYAAAALYEDCGIDPGEQLR